MTGSKADQMMKKKNKIEIKNPLNTYIRVRICVEISYVTYLGADNNLLFYREKEHATEEW